VFASNFNSKVSIEEDLNFFASPCQGWYNAIQIKRRTNQWQWLVYGFYKTQQVQNTNGSVAPLFTWSNEQGLNTLDVQLLAGGKLLCY